MPGQAPPVRDERDGLRAYLRQQQDAFRFAVHGLDDRGAGRPTGGRSTLTLGALLKHVTAVQDDWLASVRAAPGPHVETRTATELDAAREESWTWREHDSLPAALEAYDAVCAAVLDAVATTDPGTPVPVPPAPWNPDDVDAWSVRWVWLHLVEELARHAGHADLLRENLDGATMWEVMAAREGWPATAWLTPWSPERSQEEHRW